MNDELRANLNMYKCQTRHCDRSSDDDHDEMDDMLNENLSP